MSEKISKEIEDLMDATHHLYKAAFAKGDCAGILCGDPICIKADADLESAAYRYAKAYDAVDELAKPTAMNNGAGLDVVTQITGNKGAETVRQIILYVKQSHLGRELIQKYQWRSGDEAYSPEFATKAEAIRYSQEKPLVPMAEMAELAKEKKE